VHAVQTTVQYLASRSHVRLRRLYSHLIEVRSARHAIIENLQPDGDAVYYFGLRGPPEDVICPQNDR